MNTEEESEEDDDNMNLSSRRRPVVMRPVAMRTPVTGTGGQKRSLAELNLDLGDNAGLFKKLRRGK